MSSLISAEITATCNALGYNNGLKYELDPYCKESIRDLIRYLRRDDENHEIRRQLGSSQVLQKDLLPILTQHSNNEDIFDLNLRLLINLMSPVILLYREDLPAEKVSRNYYLQILSHLQSAKAAFADEKIWKVLVGKLSDILKREWADRGEEKGLIIERILILARNVLHVPANANAEKRPDNDASIHDQVLWAMHTSGLIDLFLYLASSENETQYYLHILEIVSLMLREQTPKLLVSVSVTRSEEEKVKDNAALLVVRQKEIDEKAEKMRKYAGARHSRFGGTFVVKGVKSIGDRDMVVHKAPKKITEITFDQHKMKPKTPKNRLPLQDSQESRKSAYSIRLFLKEFCVEFLNGAYNPFMFSVREKISRGKAQPNDESYYFWALAFFMEFNRLYKFQIKLVSETLTVNIFHFVQSQLESWFEMMIVDKKKIPVWSKRMHLALKAYKELMLTLCEMDRSSDEGVRESAKTIKGNLFYVPDYRDLIFILLTNYTPLKFTRSYLSDLIETAHIFLKSLEHFCKTTHNMVVQRTKKIGGKKKKKKKETAAQKQASARSLEMIWELVGSEVSALLQNEELIPTNVVPFDATLDISMAQQKVEAMRKIRNMLKNGDIDQAVGLLRAAREVWPENDCFGSDDMDPSEELLAVREIFMTDIGEMTASAGNNSEDSDDESSGGEMAEAGMNVSEQNFNFSDYVKRFAKPAVVRACCELLSQFEKNSETTNHYAVKMLHRITVDCKLPAVVFQATVFRTFQRILNSRDPSHKELQKFATYIVRKFVDVASRNKLVFMELLFWKTPKEAYEVEEGYGTEEPTTRGAKNRMWTEDQEQELRVLFEEFERDKPQPDMVDWIMKNLICKERSRHNVMKKLKQLGLKATKVPKPRKSKPKTKNQKSHEDMLASDSDQSAGGSQSEDSDHSSSENSESDGSQHRAPHKSGASSINANRSAASDSDSDDHSNTGMLDEDNMDLLSATATSHRDSIRSNSDSEENSNRKSSEPLTRTQNSQTSSRSSNTNDYSQRSRNSGKDEESFVGNLNSRKSPESGNTSDSSDDENSESHFLSSLSFKSNEKSKKRASKFTDSSEDEGNTLSAKTPEPGNSRVSDGSDDENSKSHLLSASSFKSSENSKKRASNGTESSEEEGETLSSKSPLQVISNLKEFSNNKNLTNVGSDSDEDSSRISKNVKPRKSLSRKRLRKVLSSDEENYETPDKAASPSIVLSSDKKRSRKVLSSDEEEEENIRNEKRTIEIQSSDGETYATPSKKSIAQIKGGPIEIKSSDDETCVTPSHKTKVTVISTETPKGKTSLPDKLNDTPGSKMSLHLNSDSNDTPAKMTLHLNSDSNETPNTKISLQLDSDSVESPFKLNSSSFKTVNKTRILRIDSDSD